MILILHLDMQNSIGKTQRYGMTGHRTGRIEARERQKMRYSATFGSPLIALIIAIAASSWLAADDNERPPIEYSRSTPDNCVSKLQSRLESGESKLKYIDGQGYLPALLEALEVPVESQLLVFSKTSLQRHRISPRTPRAIYFNDDVYVGYCQSGEVLEISSVDPQLGAVFYTLEQKPADLPTLQRQTENCLICHSSSRTESVPGHLVRSLFVDAGGQPILSAGSYSVDHSTPLARRWGGWYVTGTHGSQSHLGNLIVRGQDAIHSVDNAQGQNVTQLADRLAVGKYLTPHSDLIALMVLEHQTLVHNRLTKANFAARQALHYQSEVNRSFGEPEGNRMESTTRRIENAGNDVVEALLLVDEAKVTTPIQGTSDFANKFSRQGPHDDQGRSLRDLDLQRRLFKYPCSYLIYSPAFDGLPREMRDYVWQRLWDVLANPNDARFKHLSAEDRRAIVDILRTTKTDLPKYWTATVGT